MEVVVGGIGSITNISFSQNMFCSANVTFEWSCHPLNSATSAHSQNMHVKSENTKKYNDLVDFCKKKTENTKKYNDFVDF